MTNTRTIKELLTIMLENEHLFNMGLCLWTLRLSELGYITEGEEYIIDAYVKANKPITFRTLTNTMFNKANFYWPQGNIKPRRRWIKRHIKKNS